MPDPFPFYKMEISIQSYAYFAFQYIAWAMIAYAFILLLPTYHTILTAWFFLQVIEIFDYFLNYNSDWFTINLDKFGQLGVSITLVKFTVLAILILAQWMKR